MLQLERVILTPHITYYSEQFLRQVQWSAAEEEERVLARAAPRDWINRWPDS